MTSLTKPPHGQTPTKVRPNQPPPQQNLFPHPSFTSAFHGKEETKRPRTMTQNNGKLY